MHDNIAQCMWNDYQGILAGRQDMDSDNEDDNDDNTDSSTYAS